MAADFAFAADYFFVGKHGPQRLAPIDRRVRLVGQPVIVLILAHRSGPERRHVLGYRQLGDRSALFLLCVVPGVEQFQEDPLCPANIRRVGRRQLPVPVVAEAEHLELSAEGGDVLLGALAGRRAGADGVLFGRQPEGVEAHRVKHALALHAGIS